jgi:hypothetical protein
MTKRKWRWVCLDTDGHDNPCVAIFREETEPEPTTWGWTGDYIYVCYSEFKAMTGLTLKPNTLVKATFGKARIVK